MSVVAWDGKNLVGDTAAHYGNYLLSRVKTFQINDTTYVGFAGDTDSWLQVLDYLKGKSSKPEGTLKFAALVVEKRKDSTSVYTMYDNLTKIPCTHPHFAVGAGADMAMTLMHIGYSAERAVEVVCEINTTCELPLTKFSILI
jgi:ATP-dependent protease HslVU (ClpYQ) peptidase subunit